MKVNNISRESFSGKVNFDNKLKKPMMEYANKVLDFAIDGKTAREKISKSTYNLDILGSCTKKTVHPKIFFASTFKKLTSSRISPKTTSSRYYSSSIRISSSVEDGAMKLNRFLDLFENYKKETRYSYNSFGEKIVAYFNRAFDWFEYNI